MLQDIKQCGRRNMAAFLRMNFFTSFDPVIEGLCRTVACKQTFASDESAGTISEEWATKLGLPQDLQVGVGAFDAHMGAVGGQIEPYYLSKVMGTSTCDMLVAPVEESWYKRSKRYMRAGEWIHHSRYDRPRSRTISIR